MDIEDPRQFKKVKYPMNEVVGMVLIASLGNANDIQWLTNKNKWKNLKSIGIVEKTIKKKEKEVKKYVII